MFREMVPDREGIFLPSIEVREHPHKGYICIATQDIPAFTLIERCPTIKFAAGILVDLWMLNEGRVTIHDYAFIRGGNGNAYSYIAMGYGGLYSHSDNPNARWNIVEQSSGRETVDIRSIKPISVGEEVTVRYMSKSGNFWFETVE